MNNQLKGQKILAIIYGTQLFGSERGNLEALRALHSAGASIHVGVSGREDKGGDVGKAARSFGFTTFEIPFGSHFAYKWMKNDRTYRRNQIKRLWTNSKILHDEIKSFQPNKILIGSSLPFLFCMVALLWNRIPLIYRMGDAPVVKSKFQMFIWKILVRRANHIVCISGFIQSKLVQHTQFPKQKTSVILNHPISRDTEKPITKKSQLQNLKRPFQLVYVGQMTEKKGVKILINAVLAADDDNLGCWIVGGSAFSQSFEQEVAELVEKSNSKSKILFFGFQNDPRPYFSLADWNVSPSIYEEPLGNVVQEAAACRIPSIISNNGGLPELIEHGRNGYILSQVTDEEILEAILKLKEIKPQWSQFGDAAYETMASPHVKAKFLENWIQAYIQS